MTPLKELPAWKTLEQHFKAMRTYDMRTAFREDARRFERLSLRCGNLLLDYSKNRMALEEEFDCEIPDDEAEKITTVQLAIDYINT